MTSSFPTDPNDPHALRALAVRAFQNGQLQQAIQLMRRVVQLAPQSPDFAFELATMFAAGEAFDEAIEQYHRALALRPEFPEVLTDLATALHRKGDLAAARESLERALEINPRLAPAWNNLGNLLRAEQKLQDALAAFRKAADLDPMMAQAPNNIGAVLLQLDESDLAVEAFRTAARIDPNYIEPMFNIADTRYGQRQLYEAQSWYEQIIARVPQSPHAHLGRALCLLLQGDFERGLPEYEKRPMEPEYQRIDARWPRWDGSDPRGRRLLLWGEQGLGDAIQFVRYAPLVAARGAQVVLAVQPELESLLKTVEGLEDVKTLQALGDPAFAFDAQAPLMSLPHLFRTTLTAIPVNMPYLHAGPAAASDWRDRLAKDGPARLRVGVAWAGRPEHFNDRNRSCHLEQFAPLARTEDVIFYSLQKGATAEQLKNPPRGMKIIDVAPQLQTFADTAALLANLDLLISVDTSVVHLAGALGQRVWTLLAAASDWRWMLEREDSPWYPTMRLFRQPKPGDWDSVFDCVAAELARIS